MNIFIFLAIFISLFGTIQAKDFGIQGQTFKITEENLLAVLGGKNCDASTQKLEDQKTKLIEELLSGKSPFHAVPGLKETEKDSSFLYDPSIEIQEDILDAEGKTIFSKGTKVNPLKDTLLEDGLLFFDGDNPKHIDWAERQVGEFKWVLVKGNPVKLGEIKNRHVFFDQGGLYTQKFHITKIPARITQQGNKLLIEECALKEPKLGVTPTKKPSPTVTHHADDLEVEEGCASGGCTSEEENESPLSVLVSLSMPKASLIALSKELEMYGGTFVLRGFPKNSLADFVYETYQLKQIGIHTPFTIDPELFEECSVSQVPCIILQSPKNFDKITGNIPVGHALEKFSETGDTKELAKQIKKQSTQW